MRYEPRSGVFETFLDDLNDSATQLAVPSGLGAPGITAQVVGLPRSGTTVLLQLLAATGAVGYPSNVMAFFHRAPWVGAMLQTKLAAAGPTLSMTSLAGRTPEPLDPHEFGYFWRRLCGHSSNSLVADIDAPPPERAQAELDAVSAVFGRPVVYKNFLALAHAQQMREEIERLRFVNMVRPAEDVAGSLLALRRRIGAASHDRVGVQTDPPGETPGQDEPVELRIARQVVQLERFQDECGFDDHADSITLSYQELVSEPRRCVLRVLELLGIEPIAADVLPPTLAPGGGFATLPAPDRRRLQDALDQARSEPRGRR